MMRSASHDNSNYHFTLFTVLAQEIIKANAIDNPSSDIFTSLVSIINKETGVLLSLAQAILKLLVESYPAISLEILRLPIETAYISTIFKKVNPLSIPEERKRIIKELAVKNITVARNVLCLFT